ncbi:MAG: WGR domain-containing protein [Pseudomonadota bacterium]
MQAEIFPASMRLHRVEPARNMRRFYRLSLQAELFGGWALMREWGRIGSPGTVRIDQHADEGSALDALRTHAARKARRGYVAAD